LIMKRSVAPQQNLYATFVGHFKKRSEHLNFDFDERQV